MPRRAKVERRIPAPDARYKARFWRGSSTSDGARQEGPGRAHRLRRVGSDRGAHRPGSARSVRAGARQRDAGDRGQAAPRRRRDVSGAGADRRAAPPVAGHALAADCRREARPGKSMQEKLANELLDAVNNTGATIKRREDTHRMAEANRAFCALRTLLAVAESRRLVDRYAANVRIEDT